MRWLIPLCSPNDLLYTVRSPNAHYGPQITYHSAHYQKLGKKVSVQNFRLGSYIPLFCKFLCFKKGGSMGLRLTPSLPPSIPLVNVQSSIMSSVLMSFVINGINSQFSVLSETSTATDKFGWFERGEAGSYRPFFSSSSSSFCSSSSSEMPTALQVLPVFLPGCLLAYLSS